MNIVVNGEKKEVALGQTLSDLLTSLNVQQSSIAVVVNNAIVPRSLWSKTEVKDADVLELFSAVAGG